MWFSNLTSILDGRFRELVIPLLVLGLTNSPLATGLVALSQQLGAIIFAIPVGTWIEPKNKLKVILISKILISILLFILSYLIFLNQANSIIIAFLLFIIGILGLVNRTAFTVIIPKVSGRDKLINAHTSLEGADALSTTIGPVIGGILLTKAGADTTILVCGFLALISMGIMLNLKIEEEIAVKETKEGAVKERVQTFLAQSKEGIAFLFNNSSQLVSTLVICSLSFSTIFIELTIIIHANSSLGLSPFLTGIILAFAGIGNLIGVVIMKYFKNTSWMHFLLILLMVSACGVLLIGFSTNLMLICFGMLVFDGALSMAFIVQATVHQGITPDNALARVRSSSYVIGGIFAMLGSFLAGVVPQFFSTNIAFMLGFCFLIIPALIVTRYKKESTSLTKLVPIPIK